MSEELIERLAKRIESYAGLMGSLAVKIETAIWYLEKFNDTQSAIEILKQVLEEIEKAIKH